MTPEMIFILQFSLTLFVISALAVWYAAPWLATLSTGMALTILVLPHIFRHLGLSFLIPNLNSGGLPEVFAITAGYGDLVAGVLAFCSLAALKWKSAAAIPLMWLFNVVGTVDLFNALRQTEAIQHFGPTWFIPTFVVPLLLVTHAMIFVRLVKRSPTGHENPA